MRTLVIAEYWNGTSNEKTNPREISFNTKKEAEIWAKGMRKIYPWNRLSYNLFIQINGIFQP